MRKSLSITEHYLLISTVSALLKLRIKNFDKIDISQLIWCQYTRIQKRNVQNCRTFVHRYHRYIMHTPLSHWDKKHIHSFISDQYMWRLMIWYTPRENILTNIGLNLSTPWDIQCSQSYLVKLKIRQNVLPWCYGLYLVTALAACYLSLYRLNLTVWAASQ